MPGSVFMARLNAWNAASSGALRNPFETSRANARMNNSDGMDANVL